MKDSNWRTYFATHEQRSIVKFNPFKQGFFYKEKRLKGLTKELSKIFFSDYKYISGKKKRIGKTIGVNPKIKSLRDGNQRGKVVHTELSNYVNKYCFGNEKLRKKFLDNHRQLHTYTLYSIYGFPELDINPILAEVPVADVHNYLASACDLLYVNKNDELGIIEMKTGFDGCFTKGSGPLDIPDEQDVPTNSPLNQAQLQLTFTLVLLERTFQVQPTFKTIINVSDSGIDRYELTDWFYERRYKLYDYFLQRRKETKEVKVKKEKKQKKTK
jgi:hypothetical protein